MFVECVRYRVDVLGGDGNASIYRYFKDQEIPNIQRSSFIATLRRILQLQRSYVGWLETGTNTAEWKNIRVAICDMQYVTSNRYADLEKACEMFNMAFQSKFKPE